MITRRRVVILAALLLLAGITVVVWEVADWPPPRLILKYGFPPAGGPTGRTRVIDGIEFVELSPGYFRSGSHHGCTEGDLVGRLRSWIGWGIGSAPHHRLIECPREWVEIPRAFWIGTTEVTHEQFSNLFPDKMPVSELHEPECPAEEVSWLDANRFCTEFIRTHSVGTRLPTVEEWEYACGAGSDGDYSFRGGVDALHEHAWYAADRDDDESHRGRPGARPVGTRRPNAWGLHDMHGSVWEWCEKRTSAREPRSKSATLCPRKGGSWRVPHEFCRSAYCGWSFADLQAEGNGFRLVLPTLEDE